jgi:hypothetical protein
MTDQDKTSKDCVPKKDRSALVRLGFFVAGGAAAVVAVLIPPTAPVLMPAAALAIGIGIKTPGVK